MATLPFLQPATRRHREPLTGARLIIVSVAIGFAIFLHETRLGVRAIQVRAHILEHRAEDEG